MTRAIPADGVRLETLNAAEAALASLAPNAPAGLATLMRHLFEAVPSAELAAEAPESIAAAAASLWSFAGQRKPGQGLVRLTPAAPGRGGHAVVEIVSEDMPFLVDSVLAALALRGRAAHRLLHPILAVTRDAEGRLTALGEPGGKPESMMRVELNQANMLPGVAATPEDDLAAIEQTITRTLAQLRLAIGDFPAMRSRLEAARAEVASLAEGETAADFLAWMAEGNFVLLGHRKLMLNGAGLIAEDELGLLRDADQPVFDALRDMEAVPAQVREGFEQPIAVSVAKANMRAMVHRPQHADVVATRITDTDGKVTGVRLFVGLFGATAYNRNPRSIPWLAQKVERILAAAGVDPESHDGRALRNILDTWPRDELFQAGEADILKGAVRALDLAIRPRAAISLRRDPFERFISVIAWLPRDTFDTRLRERVGGILARVFNGRISAYYMAIGDAPLARVHYIIGTRPGQVPDVDEQALEAAIEQASRSFADRLHGVLKGEYGGNEAARLLARWRDAFPAAYRETRPAVQGAADIALAEEALTSGRPAARLERLPGAAPQSLTLTLAHPGRPLPLADALPLFESLDLRAIEEVPFHMKPAGNETVVIHVFTLESGTIIDPPRFPALIDALSALLDGRAEADGFNRLIARAGLSWREAWLLRAMFRWVKQVGFGFAQEAVQAALADNPQAARVLVALFAARFNPDIIRNEGAEKALEAEWAALLDQVADPDADRILTRLRTLLDAVLRTNFYRREDFLALKIDSAKAGDMPAPRPWREIWVHSPRMEGCHLRAGPVARGGIRWSDRREDFRTEILGLMKAQRLKNVVIVPTGAKGGFVLKHPPPGGPANREAFMAEGIACYRLLIQGMLDLTDNYEKGGIVPPPRTVRRDGDDPYIVAAADKGTATFSDIANGISADYGFWLGDAFASGGSKGYDHKAMGITARGAWVMIARHFAEMGRDIYSAPFTMVGVGDMSGDVFGNGLLLSRETRLLAAFDHRHIFIDPEPNPVVSFAERERLFALPRSSWADYDARLISEGGGVYPRNAKFLPLSEKARAVLGIEVEKPDPTTVMRAILRAKVDLLYFGGIGTYLKASTESHADAGDRANDALRINGSEVRALVVGEGANLGVTQAGRIEAARHGARINTDALDNSAGVSTSDHEVNIKILLTDAIAQGALTEKQRDALLAEMTEEVGHLVLKDNALQSLAVSLEALAGAEALAPQAALMQRLEAAGLLDRAVAGLPDSESMSARINAGDALTRPEIAALLPHAKLWLNEAIEGSALPDDPALVPLLLDYFPKQLREGYTAFAEGHRLKRELVSTILSNMIGNRLGCAAFARLTTDSDPATAARAAVLASRLLRLEEAMEAADAAPAPASTRLEALLALRHLQETTARALLSSPELALPLEQAEAALRPGIGALVEAETARAGGTPAASRLIVDGLPEALAALVAAVPALDAAPAIVRLSRQAGLPAEEAAAAWNATAEQFGLGALHQAIIAAPVSGPYGTRARAALLDELGVLHTRLALGRLRGQAVPSGSEAMLRLARDASAVPDLAGITVALRALSQVAAS
ncbi:NAD-glutamate dehydrogenase [Acetobacteraceae bacterium H6797]|nr:NAD-glutamate dehydrogenase [Acetobacteraceae bacterium H6797]